MPLFTFQARRGSVDMKNQGPRSDTSSLPVGPLISLHLAAAYNNPGIPHRASATLMTLPSFRYSARGSGGERGYSLSGFVLFLVIP